MNANLILSNAQFDLNRLKCYLSCLARCAENADDDVSFDAEHFDIMLSDVVNQIIQIQVNLDKLTNNI